MKLLVGLVFLAIVFGSGFSLPSSETPKQNETKVFGTIEMSDDSNAKISPILVEPTDELNSTSLPIPFESIEDKNATTTPIDHKHIPHKCPHRSHISPMDIIKDIKLQHPALDDTVHEVEARNAKDHVEKSDLESPKTLAMEGKSVEILRAVPELEAIATVALADHHNTTNATSAQPQVKTGRSANPETKLEVGKHNLNLSDIEEKLKTSKAKLNEKSIREILEIVLGEEKADQVMPEAPTRTRRNSNLQSIPKTIGMKHENQQSKMKKSHLKFKRSASYSDAPLRSSASYSSGTRSSDTKYAVRTKPVRTTRSGYGGTRSATRSSYAPTRSVPIPEDIKISLNTEVLTPVRSTASEYSTTRQIEEVRSGYQTVREIPEIRTTYETVREVPVVRSNYETVREVPAVRSNYETVREVPVVVREIPQVKTIVREVPVVRTVVDETPAVKTTYTETRTTPEVRTTYVPTRSSYGTRTRVIPETKFSYNSPPTRISNYETVRSVPEVKSTYETVRAVPVRSAYETVRAVPEIKSTYETVRAVPVKSTYERTVPATKSVYTTVREAPKVRTVSYTTAVRAVPEIRATSYDDTRSFDYITDLTDLPEAQDFPVIGDDYDGDRYKRSPAVDKDKHKKRHFSHRSHVASRAATRVDSPLSF